MGWRWRLGDLSGVVRPLFTRAFIAHRASVFVRGVPGRLLLFGCGRHCARYPTGLGMECESDADCEGNDAALCTVGSPAGAKCVLVGCTEDADCPPDTVCNDFTALVPDAPIFCGEALQ